MAKITKINSLIYLNTMQNLSLDNKKTAKKITDFLNKEFKKRKKTKAILAISGGIDSAICAYLCKKAGLDLYAVILPYGKKGGEGGKVAEALNLPKNHIITIDIAPSADRAVKELEKVVKIEQVDKGNIMARQRMIIQYAIARKLNGLVIGTENLSEYYLGYFTLHGDQACDISPISGLLKTQIFELAEYLGVPRWVLEKKPTAGLWPGQTDEGEFGFSYKDADQIIYLSIIKKYPKKKIIKKGLNLKLINKVLERIVVTEYKRHPSPKCLI